MIYIVQEIVQDHKADISYLKTLGEGHDSQLISFSNTLPAIEKKLMTCQYEMGSIMGDMKHKAENGDLKDLRGTIETEFATKTDVEKVSSRFINYTKIKVTESLRKEFIDFSEECKAKYLCEENIKNLFNMLRDEIYGTFSQKNNVKNEFDAFEKKIPSLIEDISKLKGLTSKNSKDVSGILCNLALIDQALSKKCDSDTFNSLKANMSNYTSLSQMETFGAEFDSQIQKISETQVEAKNDLNNMSIIIKRFDEVLNEKCSKFTVEEVKSSIADFITQQQNKDLKDEIDEKIRALDDKISLLQSNLIKNNSDNLGTVENAIKLASSQLTHSILPMNSPRFRENTELPGSGPGLDFTNQEIDLKNPNSHRQSVDMLSSGLNPYAAINKKSLDKVHSFNRLGNFGIDFTSRKNYRSKNPASVNIHKRRINNSTVHNFSIIQSLTPNYPKFQTNDAKNLLNNTMGGVGDNSMTISQKKMETIPKTKNLKPRYPSKEKFKIDKVGTKAMNMLKNTPQGLFKNPISISRIKIKTVAKDIAKVNVSPREDEMNSQCSSDETPLIPDSSLLPSILKKKN
ncbi:unnamed protein product [Moneuplotes crassus]|uniref:Uncharacterized protein n=1 Tax=Euplotes crassus TaxID=5936 RepID=A0AAD1TZY5_EUPCR|nr:unnamed protein product [Moneuplotes crassus]